MSNFSNYTENNIIETTLRGSSFPVPSAVYLALFTSDPGEDGSGTELGDSNYTRQDAAQGSSIETGWTAASDGVSKNAKKVEFPAITDGQVTVNHFALFDAQTGGNMLYHAALSSSKTLEIDDVLTFDVESTTVTVD